MRARAVADGQQAEIPVPHINRTVGTHVESISTEWKAVYKRGRSHVGKSAWQSEDVMWTELSVGKYVSHVPGKAAIVHTAPVP